MTDAHPDLDHLNQGCPTCGVPIGDHTLRDWLAHTDAGSWEIPLHKIDPEYDQTLPLDDVALADGVDFRIMATKDAPLGPELGRLGVVELHFQRGVLGGPGESVARVRYIANSEGLRNTGRVLRDAFNRAANVTGGKG